MFNCIFCNKECKNNNSLRNHERLCRLNPDRDFNNLRRSNFNDLGRTAWNKGLSKETDDRIAKKAQNYHNNAVAGKFNWSNCKKSEETKEKIRKQKLALCAKQGTNLCGKGLRGYYKGYYCQSSWELAYVIYQLDHGIVFTRNNKGFKYIFNHIERTYFPDFYLPDIDTYVEVKGYYDKKTEAKENQFIGKLIMYKKHEMQPILEYVINKYSKDFIKLYE